MKILLTVYTLFLLAAGSVAAQGSCPPHPTDGAAVFLGSFTVTIEIAQSGSVSGKSGKKETKCTAEQLICVWRTSSGVVDLIGDPATVKFSGTCTTDIPAADLFAMFGQKAVARGVSLGYIQCSPTCDGSTAARYMTVTCVKRNGSGTSTTYGPCTTIQCVRAYTVCCPNGTSSPKIDRAPASNSGCGTTPEGCASACDNDCPPEETVIQ